MSTVCRFGTLYWAYSCVLYVQRAVESLMLIVSEHVEHMSKEDLSSHHHKLVDIFLPALNYRAASATQVCPQPPLSLKCVYALGTPLADNDKHSQTAFNQSVWSVPLVKQFS